MMRTKELSNDNSIQAAKSRDGSLDFLKTAATICIVFHHYQQSTGAQFAKGINFYSGKFSFADLVELFFVISGFLMLAYEDRIRNGLSFPVFFAKRHLRFLPLMTLGAFVWELFIELHNLFFRKLFQNQTASVWGFIIASLGIQAGGALPNPMINNPTWYISVLLICYTVFYFIQWICLRYKLNVVYFYLGMIFLGMGIITYGINLPFLTEGTGRGYYAFFTGILLAKALDKLHRSPRPIFITLGIVFLIAFPIAFAAYPRFFSLGLGYLITFVYSPVLIIVFRSEKISRFFRAKVFSLLGQVSFDAFIWHAPLLAITAFFSKLFNANIDYCRVENMFFFLMICYFVSFLSYYWIEKPCKRITDSLIARIAETQKE